MGRGRAKAKQTKVARQLKYSSPSTDFDSLQRELSGHESDTHRKDLLEDERSSHDSRVGLDDEDDDWRG